MRFYYWWSRGTHRWNRCIVWRSDEIHGCDDPAGIVTVSVPMTRAEREELRQYIPPEFAWWETAPVLRCWSRRKACRISAALERLREVV